MTELQFDHLHHLILEAFLSAPVLLIAAVMWWRIYLQSRKPFAAIWAIGSLIVGCFDIAHGFMPIVSSGTEIDRNYVPWTWAVSCFVFSATILLAIIWQWRGWSTRAGVLTVLGMGLCSLVAVVPGVAEQMQFVQTDSVIRRPMDFYAALFRVLVFIAWLACQVKCKGIAPLAFSMFLLVGVMPNVVMAFLSYNEFDPAFYVAHYSKILDYGIWLWVAWFLFMTEYVKEHSPIMKRLEECQVSIKKHIEDVKERTITDFERTLAHEQRR